ncbi:hypothetical protein GT025_01980 [Streptomyces sp. SID4920]|nr:hypothetical protein [Streptomyces sp. SID4920]MYX64115.1 hypothetical protein [Streptomyces sp. SID8373]
MADPATGEIRLLEDRCTTCVLNPAAAAAPLRPGRLQQLIREVQDCGGQIVCHSTLRPVVPEGFPAAMCRGFIDAYGLPLAAQEAIELGVGHIVEVPDPTRIDVRTNEVLQRVPGGDTAKRAQQRG